MLVSKGVYYNDSDAYVAAWLRNLIAAGLLPEGDVDERSITEVSGCDLAGYVQCHFFAGIGGWPLALQLAGWPPSRPVWTGSCPCQPFSAAGKRLGSSDSRHLWPVWLPLIAERRPPTLFGEQVASKAGRLWLAGVRSDLETLGYACGAADLCAAGLGAPHIRQRLWWVADASPERRQQVSRGPSTNEAENGREGRVEGEPDGNYELASDGENRAGRLDHSADPRCPGERLGGEAGPPWNHARMQEPPGRGPLGGLAHNLGPRLEERPSLPSHPGQEREAPERDCDAGGLGEPDCLFAEQPPGSGTGPSEAQGGRSRGQLAGPSSSGFWFPFELLPCLDDKARRIEPGLFPLAHGVPARVGKLRAYGNAIVPQVAAEFVRAWMDCRP